MQLLLLKLKLRARSVFASALFPKLGTKRETGDGNRGRAHSNPHNSNNQTKRLFMQWHWYKCARFSLSLSISFQLPSLPSPPLHSTKNIALITLSFNRWKFVGSIFSFEGSANNFRVVLDYQVSVSFTYIIFLSLSHFLFDLSLCWVSCYTLCPFSPILVSPCTSSRYPEFHNNIAFVVVCTFHVWILIWKVLSS